MRARVTGLMRTRVQRISLTFEITPVKAIVVARGIKCIIVSKSNIFRFSSSFFKVLRRCGNGGKRKKGKNKENANAVLSRAGPLRVPFSLEFKGEGIPNGSAET